MKLGIITIIIILIIIYYIIRHKCQNLQKESLINANPKLAKTTLTALQEIVDRISDSYVVLDENDNIIEYNKTFIKTFQIEERIIENKNFIKFLKENEEYKVNVDRIERTIKKIRNVDETVSIEEKFDKIKKIFTIEITSINSYGNSVRTLILFKDITQHKKDMFLIRKKQGILMERERLASLGQLIGGIAHNIKTPIMSISGATEGLEDLIKEYNESIDDPNVNSQDHHEIAREMKEWISKIRVHIEYISDIITTVKGQAVALSGEHDISFTIEEFVKRVNILMKHELKNAYIDLKKNIKIDDNFVLEGDVNSLVQVVNNMISNSIQAYNGKRNETIELEISKNDNEVIFTIKDNAGGVAKEVQDKLFKEMVTTKGKNGTGLGLYMSYSNIKAHFGGDITFTTEEDKGTTFNIIIPINEDEENTKNEVIK